MYTYQPSSDGCCDTFDIRDPDGHAFASVYYWDGDDPEEATLAEGRARLVVHRLNLHDELVRALHYLLEQTVEMDLRYGVGLSEGEAEARTVALAVLERAVNVRTGGGRL